MWFSVIIKCLKNFFLIIFNSGIFLKSKYIIILLVYSLIYHRTFFIFVNTITFDIDIFDFKFCVLIVVSTYMKK